MSTTLQLLFGVLLISSIVSYAWWIKIRVWMLRQDLFVVRDVLWDKMREEGLLNHPAHRWCRNNINAMIRFAPAISWVSVITMFLHRSELTPSSTELGVNLDHLPLAIDDANRQVREYVLRYLFDWTLTGWCIWFLLSLLGRLKAWQASIVETSNQIILSEQIRRAGRHFAAS